MVLINLSGNIVWKTQYVYKHKLLKSTLFKWTPKPSCLGLLVRRGLYL